MRGLFLNHNVVGSGTFSRAFQLARQLAERGHQMTLITTSRRARLTVRSYECDGVELIEAPDLLPGRARTGWDPYNTCVRTQLVSRRAFDVVHAFDSRPAVIYPALRSAGRSQALFIMDWADWWGRGGWIHERSGWFVRTAFGPIEAWFEEAYRMRAHGMTVASRALRDRSIGIGVAPDRIEVLPGGCVSESAEAPTREMARASLGVPAESPVVLHIGVLTRGDHAFLQEAFVQVRNTTENALLVLAGRTGIRVHNAGNTHVTGPLGDGALQKWLAAANVCVVPCRNTIGNHGRWPSKVNDYISAGRAVVMPSVSDAATAIEKADAGWVTPATVDGFAAGMVQALKNPSRADAAGERGRTMARGELAWPRLAERLLGFYDRVAAQR